MPISHTATVIVAVPSGEIDLATWIFGLSDQEYQACATGHHGAGSWAGERERGMVNIEAVGGHLIVQHYRARQADPTAVEMFSRASRVYLFHLVPVAAAVRWKLAVTPRSESTSDFSCTVDVTLPPVLELVARLSLLGHFLARHVDEETPGFAIDIARKQHRPVPSP